MSYEAICFDLDSTLCEPIEDRAALLEATFERAGVEQFCTPAQLRHASRDLPTADTDREFFEHLFSRAAERAGVDPAVAPDLAEASIETVDPARVRFRDGAETALERAAERGPVGLITNGGEQTQTKKLEALGLLDAFDAEVFVDPTNGVPPKPDSTPFELALSALEVDPTETIHIGDNLHADVAGANAMGMDSAWIDLGHGTELEHQPTYRLTSLEEFDSIV
ncbi:HAD family hydrolase [Halostagnicola kamekurae]|uniref:Putative hydrolase of the HAD superfamily n=1 Tax=Halostagnicola kamekurae TaxID=619731 RepID=A0A1I6RWQ8_9EURY|nr:HAD family hydrolase [Halostagnicola kamekurae]SFS69116.1 putative hydrolase of the HAD superfamily [Halostagnicola kamekurae]